MYASFDFIVLTGIMRFVNRSPEVTAPKEGPKPESSKTYNAESHDEFHDESADFSDDSSLSSTPLQFLFPPTSLPSAHKPFFSFLWRGEETGEGEIQLCSDQKLCSLKFESPHALSGTFISSVTGRVPFRGIKRETGSGGRGERTSRCNPAYEWHSRNEAAYERARIGRWR